MNDNDYQQSVIIICTASTAFKALTKQLDQWWSSADRNGDEIGAIFTVSFGPDSYWTFEVMEMDSPYSVSWKCIASHQDHHLEGIDEEWLNSTLHWQITENDHGIAINFTHQGLIKTGICYDVCSAGWDFYILKSLKQYLETGVGLPGGN